MSTRETILRSWWAARRSANETGAIVMTAPTFAGYALEQSGGDATAAHELVPKEPVAYSARVHSALDLVRDEELGAKAQRAAGGSR